MRSLKSWDAVSGECARERSVWAICGFGAVILSFLLPFSFTFRLWVSWDWVVLREVR